MAEQHVSAPAKINLWLRVFAPDATGYHPLDTLFCALDLCDDITLQPGGNGIELNVTGAQLGAPHHNLAWRAADAFYRTTGIKPGVRIDLHKRIPHGAGLGGGSSDAAAVLRALNDAYDVVLSDADLFSIGARLGSDVAFFLCGASLARATGRGEILEAMPALPRAPVLIIAPDFGIATADAYDWLDEAAAFADAKKVEVDAIASWNDVAGIAHNDFEAVVFARHEMLAELKRLLIESGARIAMLSGSGATLFGVYTSETDRDGAGREIAGTVRAHGARVISTYSRVV